MAETASKEKEKKSFFKGLKAEFGKVIWPAREAVGRAVVVACSVALGLIIALLDLIIKFGLSFLL
jgi:preprotein translocase subunit SecE